MKLRLALSAFACALTLATAASADPTPAEIETARKLFKQAETDEAAGSWNAALDELRRASSIKMTAGLRFHIALCEEKLGQLASALADYTAADLLSRTENNHDVEDAVREPLAALKARVPAVTIVTPPDVKDVVVKVDGTVVTDTSVEVRLDPGAHVVEARASGRGNYSKDLALKEHDAVTVHVELPKLVDAPKEEAPPPSAPVHGRSRLPAILATGGAVVLVGVGIGAFVVAGGAQSTARDACANGSSDCDSDKSTVHVWDTVALASWIGAAGVAGLAVVLWAQPSSSAAPAQTTAKSVRLGAGPGTLRLEGSF